MKKRLIILFVILAAQPLFSQEAPDNEKVEEILNTRKVTFSFTGTALPDALFFLSDITEVRIVLDQKCKDPEEVYR